ncbi:hypothetical protein V1514DRAFT_338063 [Lipomyces japonicus]|uniref:uncharacterized protein n=1 Tax=Lipomyces japonicus TaxID=56871 RepID=UPI0034CE6CD8
MAALTNVSSTVSQFSLIYNYDLAAMKPEDLRKAIITLQDKIKDSEGQVLKFKLREQTLEKEIESVKSNNTWLDSELKLRTSEVTELRNVKTQEINLVKTELLSSRTEINELGRQKSEAYRRSDVLLAQLDAGAKQISNLEQDAKTAEFGFRKELESQKKLISLWQASSEDGRSKIIELETALTSERKAITELSDKFKHEVERAQIAESKVSELELRHVKVAEKRDENIPCTPTRSNSNSELMSPEILSPAARAISNAQKGGGISLTQVFSDLNRTKQELVEQKRQNKDLKVTLDGLIQQSKDRAPIIVAERAELVRLRKETRNASSLLDKIETDKEGLHESVISLTAKLAKSEQQTEVYKHTVSDLSRQVKVLAVEVHASASENFLSQSDKDTLLRLISDASDATSLNNSASENLVQFKSLIDLQTNNERLVHITNELSAKLQAAEAKAKSNYNALQDIDVDKWKLKISGLENSLKRLQITAESYKRERDMLQAILKKKLEPEVAELQPITNTSTSNSSVDSLADSEPVADIKRQLYDTHLKLIEITDLYNAYKTESAADLQTLNEQVSRLLHQKTVAFEELARSKSQAEITQGRLQNITASYGAIEEANKALKGQNGILQGMLSRQDHKTQSVAIEIVDLKSELQAVQSEFSNLKAEKTLWSSIHKRLTDDIDRLNDEKSRLNSLISYFQEVDKEREVSDSEARKRLGAKLESHEKDLENATKKIEEIQRDYKKLQLEKEAAKKDFDLNSANWNTHISQIEAELTLSRTNGSTLQEQVTKVNHDLAVAQEKISTYKRQTSESEFNLIQNLETQTENLKKELENSINQVKNSETKVSELESKLSETEAALSNITLEFSRHRENAEQSGLEQNREIEKLRTQIAGLISEAATASSQFLQGQDSEKRERWKALVEKQELQGQIDRVRATGDKRSETIRRMQDDLRRQMRVAQEAQSNYQAELVKHGETAKQLCVVRDDHLSVLNQVHSLTAESELVKAELSNFRIKFTSSNKNYEENIRELKSRIDALIDQNRLLQGQIGDSAIHIQESTTRTSNNDVIKYLRRDKEIAIAQYELAQQEIMRLEQHVQSLNSSLSDAHTKLNSFISGTSSRSDTGQVERALREMSDKVSLLEESNKTLRYGRNNARKEVQTLHNSIVDLKQKIQPLQAELELKNSEINLKVIEIKGLQSDNDQWKTKAQQILQKYEKIDPVNLQLHRDEVSALKKLVESIKKDKTSLENELKSVNNDLATKLSIIGTMEKELIALRERVTELEKQEEVSSNFKAKSDVDLKASNVLIANQNSELSTLKTELQTKVEAFEAINLRYEKIKKESNDKLGARRAEVKGLKAQIVEKDQEIEKLKSSASTDKEALSAELTKSQEVLESKVKELEIEIVSLQSVITQKETEINIKQKQLDEVNSLSLSGNEQATTATTAEAQGLIPQLQSSLETTKNELELAISKNNEFLKDTSKLQSDIAELQSNLNQQLAEAKEEASRELELVKQDSAIELEKLKKKAAEDIAAAKSQQQQSPEESTQKIVGISEDKVNEKMAQLRSELELQYKSSLEEQLSTTKDALLNDKDAAVKAAREAVRLEISLRSTMLQKKADKLESEKAAAIKQLNDLRQKLASDLSTIDSEAVVPVQLQSESNDDDGEPSAKKRKLEDHPEA